jgi:aspartate aminotransferase/aminotransferase
MRRFSNLIEETSEAMSIKYNTMVYGLRDAGVDVITMSLGEAFFEIPLYDFKAIFNGASYHYSNSRGNTELRGKIANLYKQNYSVDVDRDSEILITTGSKAAIYFALAAILNSGDEVIIPDPSWVSYPEQVKLCGGVPIEVPHFEKVGSYEKYLSANTKALILCNPHNPTGYVYTKDELSRVLEFAKKNDLWVLCDEAYSEFCNDEEFLSLASLDYSKANVITFNSFSKNFGISGWRLGYVISNRELISRILKINQHLITCAPSILEDYLVRYMDDIQAVVEPQIKMVLKNRNIVQSYIDKIGLKVLNGTSTFYFFVSIENSCLNSEKFATKLLEEHGVATVPGIGYGKSCDKFLRLSIGTEPLNRIFAGLDKIKSLIDDTSELQA